MNLSKSFHYSILALLIGLPTLSFAQTSLSAPDKKQFEQLIHDYLMEHPEVIREAIMAEQQKQMKAMEDNTKKMAISEKDNLLSKDSPSVGATKPQKMMVMFFDYQCGHCKNVSSTVDGLLVDNKDMKVIFKELPIFGQNSLLMTKAALAANKQGKYIDFHQKLMGAKEAMDENKLMALAKEVGLNTEQLKNDMSAPEVEAEIKANKVLAKKLGLRGTPAFFITCYPEVSVKTMDFVPGEASKEHLQSLITKAKSK